MSRPLLSWALTALAGCTWIPASERALVQGPGGGDDDDDGGSPDPTDRGGDPTDPADPPEAQVSVYPPAGAAGYTALTCRVAASSVGQLTVRWTVDGAPHTGTVVATTLPGDTVPGFETDVGQVWRCEALVDGSPAGAAEAEVVEGFVVDGGVRALPPGEHDLDVVELVGGATLLVEGEVVVRARWLYVDDRSVVDGTGAGWAGGSGPAQDGGGPGGGPGARSDGGGGGGHGGAGGRGTEGDAVGAAYGAADAVEADAGSGGGGYGGAGGAGLRIDADAVQIDGLVRVDGGDGEHGFDDAGGGGGAGGTVLIVADEATITGTLAARGGEGSAGYAVDEAGGGGGGGRIKVLADRLDAGAATFDTSGGRGGPAWPSDAQDGGAGTVHTGASSRRGN